MFARKSVLESVREEVDRHHHRLLKLEESAIRIAVDHKCNDHSLIRLALLRRSRDAQTVLKL
ncbi:hypothetical protein [Pelagibacterium luteolum]|uniref:Uncharacterized protein n=1 Tax=Pelagibacterium luteolum TaxID=440168 RepID=A0A1G8A1R0_9HYPH|nr:hypothetical protein [Pelagibacterium luteolum]SDH14872.1 hypothetical protein SAMN04487974_1256 [Pelagibacterium luteolum]